MATPKSITELAGIIQNGAVRIDEWLRGQQQTGDRVDGSPFALGAPPAVVLPPELLPVRRAVEQASEELLPRLLGPVPYLVGATSPRAVGFWLNLHGVARFRVAEQLAPGEEASYDELARRCGLAQDDLLRLLRTAISLRVFEEPRKGFVRHNATSAALAASPDLRSWMAAVYEELVPSMMRVFDAMETWPGSGEPNETGFGLKDGRGEGFFDVAAREPPRAKRFAEAMRVTQAAEGARSMVANLSLVPENGTVVDVGGSSGDVMFEILRKYPLMTGVVQDVPEVVESARVPDDLEGRLTFQVHDFFANQPVKGADVYFFRMIFHDWSRTYAVRILKALIPALKPGSRIIVNEMCVPEPGETGLFEQQLFRSYDFIMKSFLNGRERDADEWHDLFAKADERFEVMSIRRVPGSQLSLIEVVWDN